MKSHSKDLNDELLQEIDTEVESNILESDAEELEQKQLSFINDESKANDVLYWYQRVLYEINDIRDWQREEGQRIDLFVELKIEKMEKKVDFYEKALESFLMADGAKSKSLLNGKIGTRKTPDKVSVTDTEKFINWYHTNNTGTHKLIKEEVVRKPVIKEIKKYIKESGDCPPDIEFINGELKFYIKTYE